MSRIFTNSISDSYSMKKDDAWDSSWHRDANQDWSHYQNGRDHDKPANDDDRRKRREIEDQEERRKAQRYAWEQKLAEENRRKLLDEKRRVEVEKLLTPESGILKAKLHYDGKWYVWIEVQKNQNGDRPSCKWIEVHGEYYCKWCDKNLQDYTLEVHLKSKNHLKGVEWKQPRRDSFRSDTDWKASEFSEEWFERKYDEWGTYVQCNACGRRADQVHVNTSTHSARVQSWKDRTKTKIQPIEEWLMHVFWYPDSTKEYDLGIKCLLCDKFCQDLKSHGPDPDKASKEHQRRLTSYGSYIATVRKRREEHIRKDKTGLIKEICDRQKAALVGPNVFYVACNPRTSKPKSSSNVHNFASSVEKHPGTRTEDSNVGHSSVATGITSRAHSNSGSDPATAASSMDARPALDSVNVEDCPHGGAVKDTTPKTSSTAEDEPTTPIASLGSMRQFFSAGRGELPECSGAMNARTGQATTSHPKAPAKGAPISPSTSCRQGPPVPPDFAKTSSLLQLPAALSTAPPLLHATAKPGPQAHPVPPSLFSAPPPLHAAAKQEPLTCPKAAPVQTSPSRASSHSLKTESSSNDIDSISGNWIHFPNDLVEMEPPSGRPPIFSSAVSKATRSFSYPELDARDDRSRISTTDEWLNGLTSKAVPASFEPKKYIVTHPYNGRECTLDGQEELGYLELYIDESVTLLSDELVSGETHNQYRLKSYGYFEDTRGKNGWAPMACVKKKLRASRLTP